MRIELRSIELLLAVAERGSIGEAAKALKLSQPTVSVQLRRLERRLGLPLVDRSARGSRLTPLGVAVTDWAREVLSASDRFEAAVAALCRERSGQLRVAASMTIAEYLLPGWLADLHTAQPDLTVALRVGNSTQVAHDVATGQAEIGFVEGISAPAGLDHRVFGRDHLVVVVATTHPWARRDDPIGLDEFLTASLVVREPGSGTRETFDHALGLLGRSARPAAQLGSTAAIKTALLDSDYVGVLSALAIRSDLDQGNVTTVEVTGLDLTRPLRLIWPEDTTLHGATADLARRALGRRDAAT